ncbi:hypothetical protein REPUB_Repub18cG0003000 [Reevesia pubescens]
MVLSWGTHDVQNVNSEPLIYETKQVEDQSAVEDEAQHLQYCWDTFELTSYAFLDPYIDLNNNILYPENYTPPFLPYFSSSPHDPFKPEIIPYQNFSSYPLCPKRQKLIEHHYCSDFVPDDSCLPIPGGHKSNNVEGNVETCKKVIEKCVPVQIIAARERRRKITEKTQELGKLVPGGNKMNTAEMLQTAFNYIKYLQAQVEILQLMDSFRENEKAACKDKENMQIVTSPKVQHKCLVPVYVVLSLTTLSEPPLSDQLSRLLPLAPHPHD